MVPRKDSSQKLISKRLYHIFSQSSLDRVFAASGFGSREHFYVKSDGGKTMNEKDGRNMVSVMKKSIWK